METILEENGNNLSAGQKQRLAIVRALLKKPDRLIMDEATSNLDTITEQNINEIINQVCSEITVIIIAHRLWAVRDCDYIYVMEEGKIKEEGNHSDLLKKKGIYSDYWKYQI